jgi:hypothetical protein
LEPLSDCCRFDFTSIGGKLCRDNPLLSAPLLGTRWRIIDWSRKLGTKGGQLCVGS